MRDAGKGATGITHLDSPMVSEARKVVSPEQVDLSFKKNEPYKPKLSWDKLLLLSMIGCMGAGAFVMRGRGAAMSRNIKVNDWAGAREAVGRMKGQSKDIGGWRQGDKFYN